MSNNISLLKMAFKTFLWGKRENEGINLKDLFVHQVELRLMAYFFLGAAFFAAFFGLFFAGGFLAVFFAGAFLAVLAFLAAVFLAFFGVFLAAVFLGFFAFGFLTFLGFSSLAALKLALVWMSFFVGIQLLDGLTDEGRNLGYINLVVGSDVFLDCGQRGSLFVLQGLDGSQNHNATWGMFSLLCGLLGLCRLGSSSFSHFENWENLTSVLDKV